MSKFAPYNVTAATVTAGVLGSACAYYIYKQYTKRRIPTEWKQVGTLSNIYAYPVKSCGPVILEGAEITIMGLKDGWLRDRILMVIDEKDNFITARAYPDLLLVEPTVRNSILTLKHKDMEPVHVNMAEVIALQTPKVAYACGDPVPVLDCGSEVSEWYSRLLNKPSGTFRLVYYASQATREVISTDNLRYKGTKNDTSALSDEYSFNIINEASVHDLNKRVTETRVTHRNFRPNFVLKGCDVAFEEDKWNFIKIGEHIFEVVKPCARCILTTIDPETGVRNPKSEPLKTLQSFRQFEDPVERRLAGYSPRMGLQLGLRSKQGGRVSLNDPIYVA